jgi:KaiC/GvpD/RAD55 family RecA-like ATPase
LKQPLEGQPDAQGNSRRHSVRTVGWSPGHDVQFYENEEFLNTAVAGFLSDGVRVGQPIIVIATGAHRNAFAARMRSMGLDPDDLVHGRDAVWLDARETLTAFMEGGRPNRELFEATVGNVFETLITNRRYIIVRAYGEMVDLLWNEGKAEAAIALEVLWNELAAKYSFSLLCAYSKHSLSKDRGRGIEHICGQHMRVLPSEFVVTLPHASPS